MSVLTSYLQREFIRQCPPGWTGRHEVRLLSNDLETLLGYAPRADVLLERHDGSRRLWIEFEISRADPVANHAKFATAHLFLPQPPSDTFLAMVSPHIARGRRNLASNTVRLMRAVGMRAFQTVLFPQLSPSEIQRLNHDTELMSLNDRPAVESEIERALTVTEVLFTIPGRRMHLVGDLLDVMINLRTWNEELLTLESRKVWGKRTVTYFVFDPHSKCFAPSKYCAYLAIPQTDGPDATILPAAVNSAMTVEIYANYDREDGHFDGNRAWTHLTKRLAMVPRTPSEAPSLIPNFQRWLDRHMDSITVHRNGPVFLLPPPWF